MSIKKRKFDSIEKMLSFPKYITLDNDTLTLKNCIINFDFSLVNFISTISPQSIVCVSNEQKETEDTGKLYEVNCNIYNPQIEMFARFKMKSSFHKTKRII